MHLFALNRYVENSLNACIYRFFLSIWWNPQCENEETPPSTEIVLVCIPTEFPVAHYISHIYVI